MHLPSPILPLSTASAPDFEQLLQTGNHHARQGEMIAAERYYQQAIAAYPHSVIAHQNLAEVLRQQRRFDEANEYYQRAIALGHAATQPLSQKSSPTSQENSPMNMMSSPSSVAQPYLQLAFNAIEQRSWERAIILAQQELQQNPNSSEAYRLLGQARQATHQLSQAQRCYQRAIALDSDNADALANLGDFYAEQGQLNEAVATYQEAIAHYRSQTDTQPLTQPQPQHHHQSLHSAAVSPAIESQAPKPVDVDALLQEATDRMAQRQWDRAIALYRQVLEVRQDADIYRLLGNALLANQQLDGAAKAYLDAVNLHPDFAEAHANLGTVYAKLHRWDQAIRHYRKAVDLKPDSAGIYRNLGKIFEQLGERQRATECWYRAFTLEPNKVSAEDHVRIGDRLAEEGDTQRAEVCYHHARLLKPEIMIADRTPANEAASISDHPSSVEVPAPEQSADEDWEHERQQQLDTAQVLHNQANTYAQQGRLEEAVSAYQQSIEINPDLLWSYNNLGDSLRRLGLWHEAVEAYQSFIQREGGHAWTYFNLGNVLMQLEQWDRAVDALRKASTMDPDTPIILECLGDALNGLMKANLEETKALFQQAIQLNPDRVETYHKLIELTPSSTHLYVELGNALVRQNLSDRATAFYQIALHQNDSNAEAHFQLGQIAEQHHEWDRALSEYQQAVNHAPEESHYHHHLAVMLEQVGQQDRAIAEYRKAIEYDPEATDSYHYLSELLMKESKWQEAIEMCQKAIQLCPARAVLYKNLGDIMAHLGKVEEASRAYSQAVQNGFKLF